MIILTFESRFAVDFTMAFLFTGEWEQLYRLDSEGWGFLVLSLSLRHSCRTSHTLKTHDNRIGNVSTC